MDETEYKILFVDDDDIVLEVAEKLLSDLPYTFMATSSPAKAIQLLTMWEIAVLLCDLNMPEVDGIEVLAKAHEANPDTVSILVTGMADQEAIIRAVNEGGIWKYISKPWKPEQLIEIVKEGVERYARTHRSQAKLKILAHNLTRGHKAAGSGKSMVFKKPKIQIRSKDKGTDDIPDGRYKVEGVVGSGGTGTVYKAQDSLLGMPVAIKVLSPAFSKDKTAIATLKEEARIAMQLSHRHIVRLHNLQTAGSKYFLVMEYVEGQTMRQVIQAYEKLPLDSVVQLLEVCADALSYAHRHGIVHKDLKPENFLLTEDGVLKIIDFGIASLVSSQRREGAPVVGTPAYMSPEQIQGAQLDVRTDVFSLGVIVYELLTGRLPFRRDITSTGTIEDAGTVDSADLPEKIMRVLARAMAADPEDRWDSVDSFARAFVKAANETGYERVEDMAEFQEEDGEASEEQEEAVSEDSNEELPAEEAAPEGSVDEITPADADVPEAEPEK